MSVLVSVTILGWIWVEGLPAQVAFALSFGLCSGGLLPLGSACINQITPCKRHAGLRNGVMMAICSIGALGGGPAGAVLQVEYGWVSMQLFAASVSLLGAILILAAKAMYAPRWLGRF